MTQEEEQKWWAMMVKELFEVMTAISIADHVGVTERQVWRWMEGDRPKGFKAINVYLLHVKRCPQGQRPQVHFISEGTSLVSER